MNDRLGMLFIGAIIAIVTVVFVCGIYHAVDTQIHCVQWEPWDHEEDVCGYTDPQTNICMMWSREVVHDKRCVRRDDR